MISEGVWLPKDFLIDMQLQDSDFSISKTIADKKREFEKDKSKWRLDYVKQVKDKQSVPYKKNTDAFENLRKVQREALEMETKPKIKLLDRAISDSEQVKKNIREINNQNKLIHQEIQNLELDLKI